MMMKLKALVVVIYVLLFSGCIKDEGVCISSTGKIIIQDRLALPFHYVEVFDNINLILTQDTSLTEIKVEAGENLIDGITTEIDNGRLVLRNQNTCNWLRSFEVPVNVYLTFTKLDTLIYRAAANITCNNDWTNDSIRFEVVEGGGQIDLRLNVTKSYLYNHKGTVAINVTGYSKVTIISCNGYGPFHAENLLSMFTYLSTYSPNDVFVHVVVEMQVGIGNIGNVYYRGDPNLVIVNMSGTGKLIKF